MNATTTSTSTVDNGNNYTQEDVVLGCDVIATAITVLSWVAAAMFAWSFSGFWMVLLMYILGSLIAYLAAILAGFGIDAVMPIEAKAAVGRAAGSVANTITGWFSRK